MIPRRTLLGLAIVFEGGLFALAMVLGWWLDLRFWETLSFGASLAPLTIGLTLPVLLAAVLLERAPLAMGRQIRDDFHLVVRMFKGFAIWELALVSLLAGVGEEALFRGVLQPYLGGFMTPWLALLIASVAFGVAHSVSQAYTIFATIVGLYLGAIVLVLDDLALAAAIHALYDFTALTYGVKVLLPKLEAATALDQNTA
ncbi:MAG: CPBP family intramembrane glutamic endopeptidase [Candidatus Hydrogenedentota bacterium]